METELIVILSDGDTFAPIDGCYVAEVTSKGLDEITSVDGVLRESFLAIPEDAFIREVPISHLWKFGVLPNGAIK